MGEKYKKWAKKQREWAKELGVNITTVAKNGEEWCNRQAEILAMEDKRGRVLLYKKTQLERLRQDITSIDDSSKIVDPALAQQERIMSNGLIILDEMLIEMISKNELTSLEYSAALIRLKLIDTLLKLGK